MYRLFDFLRKQAKCGMKALQVPQSFHDKQGVKFMKKKKHFSVIRTDIGRALIYWWVTLFVTVS